MGSYLSVEQNTEFENDHNAKTIVCHIAGDNQIIHQHLGSHSSVSTHKAPLSLCLWVRTSIYHPEIGSYTYSAHRFTGPTDNATTHVRATDIFDVESMRERLRRLRRTQEQQQRQERERQERERQEQERQEQERLDRQRREQERLENERQEEMQQRQELEAAIESRESSLHTVHLQQDAAETTDHQVKAMRAAPSVPQGISNISLSHVAAQRFGSRFRRKKSPKIRRKRVILTKRWRSMAHRLQSLPDSQMRWNFFQKIIKGLNANQDLKDYTDEELTQLAKLDKADADLFLKDLDEINRHSSDWIGLVSSSPLSDRLQTLQNRFITEKESLVALGQNALLGVFSAALFVKMGFKPRSVQLLACWLLRRHNSKSNTNKGRLLQVLTGQGKSVIVGMLAALCVLLDGVQVDIITSNDALAKRDSQDQSQFFSIFGLTCSSAFESNLVEVYQKDIVYSTAHKMQTDILQQEFNGTLTRKDRGMKTVIVDEVDNMFLDSALNSCRLSYPISGMSSCLVPMVMIWNSVQAFEVIESMGAAYSALPDAKFDDFKSGMMQKIAKIADSKEIKSFFETSESVCQQAPLIAKSLSIPIMARDIHNNYAPVDNTANMDVSEIFLLMPNLSTNLPKQSEYAFFKIGDSYHVYVQTHDSLDQFIDYVYKHVEKILTSNPATSESQIYIPAHFLKFVSSRLKTWTKCAIEAQNWLHLGFHYVVRNGTVVPVDAANTGQVQNNSVLSFGLTQMLCLKEKLSVEPEGLSPSFMSVMSFFRRYQVVYGVTGTLGSEGDQKCLGRIYNVDTICLPTFKPAQLRTMPSKISRTMKSWKQDIQRSVKLAKNLGRAVLIITQYGAHAHNFAKVLGTEKVYDDDENVSQKELTEIELQPGDVVVTTTLGSRGTDYKLHPDVIKAGGLHVIMTFFPKSLRVERQCAGRAGRMCLPGTSELILLGDDFRDAIIACGAKAGRCKKWIPRVLRALRAARKTVNVAETDVLEKEMREVEARDQDYTDYCDYIRSKYDGENFVFERKSLKSDWALFIDEHIDQSDKPENRTNRLFASFENEVTQHAMSYGSIFRNPAYLVQKGNFFVRKGDYQKAFDAYTEASNLSSSQSDCALYINRAHVRLCLNANDTGEALKDLEKGAADLNKLESQWYILNVLVASSEGNSELEKQIMKQLEIISMFRANIDNALTDLKEICGNKDEANSKLLPFMDILKLDESPADLLYELRETGFDGGLTISKKPPWWGPLVVGIIGLAQVIGGGLLTVLTAGTMANIGLALLSEGIGDMIYAVQSGIQGDFSWTDYGIQKAISLAISIGSMGVGCVMNKIGQKVTQEVAKEAVKISFKTAAKEVGKVAAKEIVKAGVKELFDHGFEEALKAAFNSMTHNIQTKLKSQYFQAMQGELGVTIAVFIEAAGSAGDGVSHIHSTFLDLLKPGGEMEILSYIKSAASAISKQEAVTKAMGYVGSIANFVKKITSAVIEGLSLNNVIVALQKTINSISTRLYTMTVSLLKLTESDVIVALDDTEEKVEERRKEKFQVFIKHGLLTGEGHLHQGFATIGCYNRKKWADFMEKHKAAWPKDVKFSPEVNTEFLDMMDSKVKKSERICSDNVKQRLSNQWSEEISSQTSVYVRKQVKTSIDPIVHKAAQMLKNKVSKELENMLAKRKQKKDAKKSSSQDNNGDDGTKPDPASKSTFEKDKKSEADMNQPDIKQLLNDRQNAVANGAPAGHLDLAAWAFDNDKLVVVVDDNNHENNGIPHTFGPDNASDVRVLNFSHPTSNDSEGHYTRNPIDSSGNRSGNGPSGPSTCLADALGVTPYDLANSLTPSNVQKAVDSIPITQVPALFENGIGGTNFKNKGKQRLVIDETNQGHSSHGNIPDVKAKDQNIRQLNSHEKTACTFKAAKILSDTLGNDVPHAIVGGLNAARFSQSRHTDDVDMNVTNLSKALEKLGQCSDVIVNGGKVKVKVPTGKQRYSPVTRQFEKDMHEVKVDLRQAPVNRESVRTNEKGVPFYNIPTELSRKFEAASARQNRNEAKQGKDLGDLKSWMNSFSSTGRDGALPAADFDRIAKMRFTKHDSPELKRIHSEFMKREANGWVPIEGPSSSKPKKR